MDKAGVVGRCEGWRAGWRPAWPRLAVARLGVVSQGHGVEAPAAASACGEMQGEGTGVAAAVALV